MEKNISNLSKDEKIRIHIPQNMRGSEIKIKAYNTRGRLVWEKEYPNASSVLEWDGKNFNGKLIGSGVYVIRISSGDTVKILKIAVVK